MADAGNVEKKVGLTCLGCSWGPDVYCSLGCFIIVMNGTLVWVSPFPTMPGMVLTAGSPRPKAWHACSENVSIGFCLDLRCLFILILPAFISR